MSNSRVSFLATGFLYGIDSSNGQILQCFFLQKLKNGKHVNFKRNLKKRLDVVVRKLYTEYCGFTMNSC